MLGMKIRELVHKAQHRQLGLPEIQRGTSWADNKASTLADTLYKGWPVGSMVFWQAPQSVDVRDRTGHENATASDWVLDGQQRTTALCLMFGVTPYWKNEDRRKLQFHPLEEAFRVVGTEHPGVPTMEDAPRKKGRPPVWVDAADVLTANDVDFLKRIVANMGLPANQQVTALMNLEKLRALRERDIPVETVDVALEDVSEIFRRVNSAGTKVNAADVTLAVATAHSPGWNSDEIIPLLTKLEKSGFDIAPALLLKTVSAVFKGSSRFGRLQAQDWTGALQAGTGLNRAWVAAREAWTELPRYMAEFGVGTKVQMPALSPLVGLVAMRARFAETFNDSRGFSWAVRAAVSSRYQSGSEDRINADVQMVMSSATLEEALSKLNSSLPTVSFTPEDFMSQRTDEEGRSTLFLMWVAAFGNKAKDWKTGERLHWSEDRHPEVHHVFPRDLLAGVGKSDLADTLANLSFVTKTTNTVFSNDEPDTYLTKHGVDRSLLSDQALPGEEDVLKISSFEMFLRRRAELLASQINSTLVTLTSPSAQRGAE